MSRSTPRWIVVASLVVIAMNLYGRTDARQLGTGPAFAPGRGPYHAVVHKRTFTLEVRRADPDQPERTLLVKRVRVGLGKQNRTPAGEYVVSRKAVRPDWTPPVSSPLHGQGVIHYGQPGYPFGAAAYWIGLAPVGTGTRTTGIAIHGTADPTSIGKGKSLGCIRVGDRDMKALYALLREGVSTVRIEE